MCGADTINKVHNLQHSLSDLRVHSLSDLQNQVDSFFSRKNTPLEQKFSYFSFYTIFEGRKKIINVNHREHGRRACAMKDEANSIYNHYKFIFKQFVIKNNVPTQILNKTLATFFQKKMIKKTTKLEVKVKICCNIAYVQFLISD